MIFSSDLFFRLPFTFYGFKMNDCLTVSLAFFIAAGDRTKVYGYI